MVRFCGGCAEVAAAGRPADGSRGRGVGCRSGSGSRHFCSQCVRLQWVCRWPRWRLARSSPSRERGASLSRPLVRHIVALDLVRNLHCLARSPGGYLHPRNPQYQLRTTAASTQLEVSLSKQGDSAQDGLILALYRSGSSAAAADRRKRTLPKEDLVTQSKFVTGNTVAMQAAALPLGEKQVLLH